MKTLLKFGAVFLAALSLAIISTFIFSPAGATTLPIKPGIPGSTQPNTATTTSPVCSPDGVKVTNVNPGTIVLPQDSNVTVTLGCSSSAWNDSFGLSSPTRIQFGTGHVTAIGTTFNAGRFTKGSELIFFLTNPSGETWLNGPASRNSDGIVHADVTQTSNNSWQVGFEDYKGGFDFDYNDIILNVTATPSCTTNTLQKCVGNAVYNYDSCGNQGSLVQQCLANQTCANGGCVQQQPTCNWQGHCEGDPCQTFNDCDGNLVCNWGKCGPAGNNPPPTTCTPNWQTGNWSACSNGQQTRACTDMNHCGINDNEPATTQSCTNPNPQPTDCLWSGHCLGDPCQTFNDCDGNLVCNSGKCGPIGQPTPPPPPTTCTLTIDQVKADMANKTIVSTYLPNDTGWSIVNNTACSYPITVAASKMINTTTNQTYFDSKYYTVQPNSSSQYTVSVPSDCGYQYDYWYGNTQLADSNWPVNGLDGKIVGTPCQQTLPSGNNFAQGMVSLTFDDGWLSAYQNGYPLLDKYGIKGTEYIISGSVNDTVDGYITSAQMLDLQTRGHEIEDHTKTHVDLTTVNSTQLTDEIVNSKSDLLAMGVNPITSFDYPYGAYSTAVEQVIQNAGYLGARTSDAGYVQKTDNPYLLKAMTIINTTSVADIESWIASAATNKTWLILVIHQVDNLGNTYDISPANLSQLVDYIHQNNVKTVKVSEGLAQMSN